MVNTKGLQMLRLTAGIDFSSSFLSALSFILTFPDLYVSPLNCPNLFP